MPQGCEGAHEVTFDLLIERLGPTTGEFTILLDDFYCPTLDRTFNAVRIHFPPEAITVGSD